MSEKAKTRIKCAVCFVAGVVVWNAARNYMEREIPYSYRQTIPDAISYIFIGDIPSLMN